MTRPRLLDLYAGAGGAARGYQQAGFHVTGVDIRPQPRFAGDTFVRADALEYVAAHGDEYDAIHASPPCQAHTTLRVMANAGAHPDLIAPTRALLVASGRPYVIENVPGAPLVGAFRLCGSSFGLGVELAGEWRQLRRHRLFEASFPVLCAPCAHRGKTLGVYGDHARIGRRSRLGGDITGAAKLPLARAALGIDWMAWDELTQAIPPAYTRHIGAALWRHLAWVRGDTSASRKEQA